MAKHRTYYISGVVQVTVRAASAEEAVRKAQQITAKHTTKAMYHELDNVATETQSAVGLDEAAKLDEEGFDAPEEE